MSILRRDQRGIAVPTAMMALLACFGLSSVAVMSTLDVQQGTKRDHDSKEAIAAADAGANMALLRLNRFLPSLSVATPCIGPGGEFLKATAGWCPASPTESVGEAVYSYTVSAYTLAGPIQIVAVGSSDGVSRRVNVSLSTVSGKNVFADEKLIGQDEILLKGNPYIETDIGTNGNIVNSGGPTICGNDRHGIGKEAPTPTCDGVKTEGNKDLPPITPPADIATVNDNCRLANDCTGTKAGQVDTYSKKNANFWDSTHRTISVTGNATLTMGGTDYWLCKVDLQSGKIFMPVGSHVRIFIDTPEHCGMSAGAVQLEIGGSANIESTAYNPQQGLYEVPQIYLLGSGTVKLDGGGGTTDELILYAPDSEIEIKGNATWVGMIAGKSLNIPGNPYIKSDSKIKEPDIALASLFQRTRYVECTGATASPPSANC